MTKPGWMSTMEATNLTTALNGSWMSNTTNATSSCVRKEVPSHPFFIAVYCLVCLVSLALNAVTMRVYFCSSQRLQSSVTVYLKNLAAADFFLCLCLPLRIANYASKSITMRRIYCSFGATAFYYNMYASILFMDYIAANRYLKIVRPLETHTLQTPRAAHYISILTWVSLSGMAIIYLVVFLCTAWSIEPKPDVIGCEALHSSHINTIYKVIHSFSFVIFIFVLVSLVLLYWGTVRSLQQAQHSQNKQSDPKLNKSKRNMLVLMVVFCVCFVPYHLVRLPYAFLKPLLKHCSTAQAFYTVKELTVLLSVLNACLDPLIYFIFCKAFRAQLGLGKSSVSSSRKQSEIPTDLRRQSHSDSRVSTLRRQSVI
ncbi:P2Y purinoceptor 14-like [Hoplias malabaricus]|uniref:P2Y purinoceptor 14-like n=1 Tax=Hoplias malabaricus TaxID=27720 RepID=UPI003461E74D